MKPSPTRLKLSGFWLVAVVAVGGCSSQPAPPTTGARTAPKRPAPTAAQPPTMESTLYTRPYDANEGGAYELPAEVRWRVLPRYIGQRADGSRIVDERITVVLEDRPNSFWPVIVKMSMGEAEELQRKLAKVIEQKKRREPEVAAK